MLDCDPSEANPLCNEDGVCDTEKDYPESLENCPQDCGKKGGVGMLTWLLLILIFLALMGIGIYLYAKSKGYKLSDFIKIKGKKEEKPKFAIGQYKPHTHLGTTVHPKQPEQPIQNVQQPAKPSKLSRNSRELIRLQGFVDSSLRKGYTKLQVKDAAMKSGWTEEEVNRALKGRKSKYSIFK
ncbi:hypothetical protein FJZ53_07325 [Candidatus Woesearchaeota archaeon]|nr:hypothetical protein [Candidatus Woesearchaeota archaeon]